MNRRRGAFCADDADEYMKLAIDNEFKISPFYDDLKQKSSHKITLTDFDFVGGFSPNLEEEVELTTESKYTLLVVDTQKDLKSLIQTFCCQPILRQDDYITDFYAKELDQEVKLHFWLQNHKNTTYQTLKECYVTNFEYFLIVETRRSKKLTNQIIERIQTVNKNVKCIFKIKVSALVTQQRQQGKVKIIHCANLLEGLTQVQLMIQI